MLNKKPFVQKIVHISSLKCRAFQIECTDPRAHVPCASREFLTHVATKAIPDYLLFRFPSSIPSPPCFHFLHKRSLFSLSLSPFSFLFLFLCSLQTLFSDRTHYSISSLSLSKIPTLFLILIAFFTSQIHTNEGQILSLRYIF